VVGPSKTAGAKPGGLKSAGGKPVRARAAPAESRAPAFRPVICIDVDEARVNAEAAEALRHLPGLYQRMQQLVRVVADRRPTRRGVARPSLPWISELPTSLVRETLAKAAQWVVTVKSGADVPAHPPDWAVAAVRDRGDWPVPYLEGVVDHPVLRSDGTVAAKPGYDAATGLLLKFRAPFVIPDRPSRQDAAAACEELLETVSDFPFAAPCHKSAWLAALLTPLARFTFDGPSPLFLADANRRGSGKGLLMDCVANIVAGESFTVATYTDDEDELRRRITAWVREGDRLILFDNLTGRFGNGTLNAALTAESWTDRLLRTNSSVRGPMLMSWYGTGNNVICDEDTARRVCAIRLESPFERPEEREGFRHPRLKLWIRSNRPRLLGAALTALRAFFVAGRPDQGLANWGSYEEWSSVVRGAVVWCGFPDPAEGRQVLGRRTDTVAESMGQLLAAWEEMDPRRQGRTVAEVVRLLYADVPPDALPAWHAALKDAAEGLCETERVTPRVLAARLRRFERSVVAGRFIGQVGHKVGNAVRWAAFPASAFAEGG
jgi:hypothetical protein